jgi:tetratricopeptide (TPR) repeat protein
MPAKFGGFSRVLAPRVQEAALICPVLAHRARVFVIGGFVCATRYARVRIRCRNVLLMLLMVVLVGVMQSPSATASSRQTESPWPQAKRPSYVDVVELYRRGEDELALKQLAMLTDSEIKIGRTALLAELNNVTGAWAAGATGRIRAAVLLHTLRAIAARAHDDVGEYRYHFGVAQEYVELLVSKEGGSPFVQTWRLFVIASYHGQRGVQAAREFGRHVRDPHGDSALLLLALGATEELGWTMHQEEDARPDAGGDLKEAERLYRQAMVISPELVEARVRLGRVLALRNDDESMKVLEQIGDGIEAPYQYLARLFEGDVYERAGKLAEAEQQYLAAVAIMPEPQSAFMALAHVRHAQGARAQSAQDIRVTTGAKGVPDTVDPWFWYSRGTAWRGPVYLDDLQKMMAQ